MKVVDRNENRQTNIELLRILLMFMILMHHFLVHGLQTAGFSEDHDAELWATALDPFFFVGVNCFVMISGFFGIKLKFSGLYKLFVQCAFYGLIFYVFHLIVDKNHIGKSLIYNCLTVFSAPPGWWFIRVYVYLYLSSPLLNAVIDKLSKRRYIYFLVLLGVLNVYFGYLRQTPINPSGYTLSNFIFLYFIGRYLKLHVHYEKYSCTFWLLLYLAASMIMGVIACVNIFCLHSHSMLFNVHVYNNPLLIFSAVSLLLTFVRLNVPYSKEFNWLAYSALSIFLITENCYFSQHYYPFVATMVQGHNEAVSWLLLVAIALLSMIGCLLIDKIRIGLMRPVDNVLYKRLSQLDNRLELWLEQ